jgi:hypothetical protein
MTQRYYSTSPRDGPVGRRPARQSRPNANQNACGTLAVKMPATPGYGRPRRPGQLRGSAQTRPRIEHFSERPVVSVTGLVIRRAVDRRTPGPAARPRSPRSRRSGPSPAGADRTGRSGAAGFARRRTPAARRCHRCPERRRRAGSGRRGAQATPAAYLPPGRLARNPYDSIFPYGQPARRGQPVWLTLAGRDVPAEVWKK